MGELLAHVYNSLVSTLLDNRRLVVFCWGAPKPPPPGRHTKYQISNWILPKLDGSWELIYTPINAQREQTHKTYILTWVNCLLYLLLRCNIHHKHFAGRYTKFNLSRDREREWISHIMICKDMFKRLVQTRDLQSVLWANGMVPERSATRIQFTEISYFDIQGKMYKCMWRVNMCKFNYTQKTCELNERSSKWSKIMCGIRRIIWRSTISNPSLCVLF